MVTISKTRLQDLLTAAWLNRTMIALVYIWFGFLKVLGTSPAEGLVTKFFNITLEPFMGIQTFLLILGAGECAIGMLWLSPRLTKIAFWVMIGHLFTTFLPVFF